MVYNEDTDEKLELMEGDWFFFDHNGDMWSIRKHNGEIKTNFAGFCVYYNIIITGGRLCIQLIADKEGLVLDEHQLFNCNRLTDEVLYSKENFLG